jgi:hypothetical protein
LFLIDCGPPFPWYVPAPGTSETSAEIQLRTRQYIPEDSELQVYEGQLNRNRNLTDLDYRWDISHLTEAAHAGHLQKHGVALSHLVNISRAYLQ